MAREPRTDDAKSKKQPLEYEFSDEESSHVARLVGVMRFVGAAQPIVGLVLVAGAVLFAVRGHYGVAIAIAAPAAFYLFVAGSVLAAAKAFERVVTTEGNDLSNLLSALDGLRKVFVVQRVLIVIVGLMLAGATAAVLLSPSGGATSTDGAEGSPNIYDGTR